MNITVSSNFSENIADLYKITGINHRNYCYKHGYVYLPEHFDYSNNYYNLVVDSLKRTKDELTNSDVLMWIGADTMFMNWSIKIEDVIKFEDHIVIAKEQSCWWPINNDVMIWKNTWQSHYVLDRIINEFDTWKNYPWSVQTHLWNMIQEDEIVRKAIRIVDAKVMNQHPKDWQLGDWIVHFYGMPIPNKVQAATEFQKNWGDGTATWKVKHDSEIPQTA
jgi:hypothetical protein